MLTVVNVLTTPQGMSINKFRNKKFYFRFYPLAIHNTCVFEILYLPQYSDIFTPYRNCLKFQTVHLLPVDKSKSALNSFLIRL